jgi:hypothetical protein
VDTQQSTANSGPIDLKIIHVKKAMHLIMMGNSV